MIKLLPLLIKVSSQMQVLDDGGSGGGATLVTPETTRAVNFCTNFTPVWTILGYILFAIKVIVPILLIVTSMITFVKAIMNSNEKDTTAAFNLIKMKVIYAIAIFVIIQAVSILVGLVSKNSLYKQCATCTFKPFEDSCYIIKPATDPEKVDYIEPVRREDGTYDPDTYNPVADPNAQDNSKIVVFGKRAGDWLTVSNNDTCRKLNLCNEGYEEDGVIKVANGIFFYKSDKSVNGTEAARGSGTKGLNKTFDARLQKFFSAALEAGYHIYVANDGFRSLSDQKYFYCCYTGNYMGASRNGKYCEGKDTCNINSKTNKANQASEPGTSNHGYGIAADLGFCRAGETSCSTKNMDAVKWAHQNAEKFGLAFNVAGEDWHIAPLYVCNINGSCKKNTNIQ